MRYWKKKTNATFDTDENRLVQVDLLLVLGGGGSLLWLLFGSLIEVSSVHFCPICSVWYFPVFPCSHILLRGWAVRAVSLCQLIHFDALLVGPANFELRITKNWISLETIVNSINILFVTSLPRVVGHEMLFLCFGFAVSSTVVSLLLNDVVRDWESIQTQFVNFSARFRFPPRCPEVQKITHWFQ